MPVPVWVNDLAFVPNSEQVAICSRHGHVNLDIKRKITIKIFYSHFTFRFGCMTLNQEAVDL